MIYTLSLHDALPIFVIYGNERGILLSKFLGAKKIYADNRHAIVRLLLSNGKINYGKWIHVQDRHAYLAELYAGKPMESMKIRYHVIDPDFIDTVHVSGNVGERFIRYENQTAFRIQPFQIGRAHV